MYSRIVDELKLEARQIPVLRSQFELQAPIRGSVRLHHMYSPSKPSWTELDCGSHSAFRVGSDKIVEHFIV